MKKFQVKIERSKADKLAERMQKNAYKKAIRQGCRLVILDLRDYIHSVSGALKSSISSKVDSVRGGIAAYGIVGPRSKYIKTVNGKPKRPGRYASVLEFGKHKHPFLQPSYNRSRNQYLLTVQRVIAEEMQKYVNG